MQERGREKKQAKQKAEETEADAIAIHQPWADN
jgi:hypothetical protein